MESFELQTRDDRPRSSFEDTAALVRYLGNALRAQKAAGRRVDFVKPRPSKQVLAALQRVPSSMAGPAPVSKRWWVPRIISLPKTTTSEEYLPFRRNSPPSTTETRFSMATGASRTNLLYNERGVATGLPSRDRPVISGRICEDLRPRRSSAPHATKSRTTLLPTLI